MGKKQNLLLDFSHTYPEGIEKEAQNLERMDMGDISGTTMYCSGEAEQKIRERLKDYGPDGIHFLDNGNYHYVTKFFTEKIRLEHYLQVGVCFSGLMWIQKTVETHCILFIGAQKWKNWLNTKNTNSL